MWDIIDSDLIDDRDIVQAAISQGGLELQYASRRLQADPDIVRLACLSDGRALGYCPLGPTLEELTHDREFMKDVVLAKKYSGGMWKLAPPCLQDDPELLLQALMNGLSLRDIPEKFKKDLPFLQQTLQVNCHLYLELSPTLQAEVILAREAIISSDSTPEIHNKALRHCPLLKEERQVVLTLCQRGDVEILGDLLDLPSSRDFTDDREIMIAAVSRDPSLLTLASIRLRSMPELILVSITPASAYSTIKTLPHSVMRELPEIPTRAVEVCLAQHLRYLPAHIPDEVWANHRPLCCVWLQRGGRVLEAFEPQLVVQPPYTPDDIELPLTVARYNWRETHKVGGALLGDKAFILQALELDGRILRFAAAELRQELEIQVVAVANYNKNIPEGTVQSIEQYLGGYIDIAGLAQHIEERLQLHHTFCQYFLRGIAIPRPHRPPQLRSQLPMLDRGVETSEAFKKLIAEYLGVPLGQNLSLLRRASTNLANSSPPSSTMSTSTRSNNAEGLGHEDRDHPNPLWLQRDAFVPPPPNQRMAIRVGRMPPHLHPRIHDRRERHQRRRELLMRQAMVGRPEQLRDLHVMRGDDDDVDLEIADFLLGDELDFDLMNALEDDPVLG